MYHSLLDANFTSSSNSMCLLLTCLNFCHTWSPFNIHLLCWNFTQLILMGFHVISRSVFTFLYLLLDIPSHSLQLNLWHSCRQVGDLIKYSNLISKASFTTFNWLFIFNWLLIYVMNGDYGAFLWELWGYGTILFLIFFERGGNELHGDMWQSTSFFWGNGER